MADPETTTVASTGAGNTEADNRLLAAAGAGSLADVVELLSAGANVRACDDEGITVLMKAAESGSWELCEILLSQGSVWCTRDNDGYCAAEYASGAGHHDIAANFLSYAVQSQLYLTQLERADRLTNGAESKESAAATNEAYLRNAASYVGGDRLMDTENEAVMMEWERPIMERSAQVICEQSCPGGSILNVGFGMGIIDTYIQGHKPAHHTIIEAHPDVYARMEADGWLEKEGVRVLFGRWQDMVPQICEQTYDGIYWDTYGEDDIDLQEFHDLLPVILKPGGIYSFFNGLAACNVFFHTVAGVAVQSYLNQMGIGYRLEPIEVEAATDVDGWSEVWNGVSKPYWYWKTYFLPICERPAEEGGGGDDDDGGA